MNAAALEEPAVVGEIDSGVRGEQEPTAQAVSGVGAEINVALEKEIAGDLVRAACLIKCGKAHANAARGKYSAIKGVRCELRRPQIDIITVHADPGIGV